MQARTLVTVPSVDRSSTTRMSSTNAGMPANVTAIKRSSLYAGITTPSDLPSTMRKDYFLRYSTLPPKWGKSEDRYENANDQERRGNHQNRTPIK